jgi:hypothetical protein
MSGAFDDLVNTVLFLRPARYPSMRILIAFIGVVGGLVVMLIAEDLDWQRFVAAHHCRLAEYVKGERNATPDRARWRCDDDRDYWREE